MRLLAFNAGSSSLKFDLMETPAGGPARRVASGTFADRADGSGRFELQTAAAVAPPATPVRTLAEAAEFVVDWLQRPAADRASPLAGLAATVHRIVHGGAVFAATARLGAAELDALAGISMLAPLHNPPALAVIDAVRERLGSAVPVVGVFDTAYYVDLPEAAYRYAVPARWSEEFGVRRYGFHGTAHRSLCAGVRAGSRGNSGANRIVSLQLGRGCSVTASVGGRAVATSMGFTPLEGLVMGTRSGDLDAGALLHVMERTGMTVAQMRRELNQDCGLLGLSGRTADMRDLLALEAAGDPGAALAIAVFCRRARHYLAAFMAELGGADAIAFGGGIGENCPDIRRRIVRGLDWAGVELDESANRLAVGVAAAIATPASRVSVHVVPVDEASVLAAEAEALLGGAGQGC